MKRNGAPGVAASRSLRSDSCGSIKQITILLADDHKVVREGFRKLVEIEPDLLVVGEAQNGHEAVRRTKKCRPDVVVMDIAMPVLNGLEATRQILKTRPMTKVLIVSAHSDDAYIEEAIALGVSGYLIKQTSYYDLTTAIREAHKGNKFFSPSIAKRFRNHD